MAMKRVTSPHVKEAPPGTWSNCRVFGNQVFVAGMTANDGTGGMLGDGSVYSQAKEIFGKIRHLMEAAGGSTLPTISTSSFPRRRTSRCTIPFLRA